MEEEFKKLVLKAIEIAERTGEFVIEQAPDLLQEFYRWNIVDNIVGTLLGIFIIFTMLKIFKICGKKEEGTYHKTKILNRYYETDEPEFFALITFVGIVSIIGFGVLITDLLDLLQILVAPKLYLIEYFLK